MAPKIQMAMDTLDINHALELARLASPYVDIIEAGTPLIKSVGMEIVRKLRAAYPDKIILADLKTSDVGAYEANMAFEAGADVVTTQGITTFATIIEVQREADKWKRRAEVDMTGVRDVTTRAREVKDGGVSLVLYHRSIDEECTEGALWDECAVQTVRTMCEMGLDVAIAGGVNLNVLPLLKGVPLYAIVIGRGITSQPDPAAAARAVFECVQEIWPA